MSHSGEKRSLEEAIKLSKVTVAQDENRVIVERIRDSRKSDRKNAVAELNYGLVDWTQNEQMEALMSKVFKAEKEVDVVLQRNKALEDYIVLLEQKILQQDQQLISRSKNDLELSQQSLSKIAFYEIMTSMSVVPKDANRYVCTLKNSVNRIGSKFEITLDLNECTGESSDDTVLDMKCRPLANGDLLPEYMRSEISCNHRMAPVMLGDALQVLYDEKEADSSS